MIHIVVIFLKVAIVIVIWKLVVHQRDSNKEVMLMKRVFWNGNKYSYLPCQPASNLETGRCYEVIQEDVYNFQTNYYLKGVDNYGSLEAKPGYSSIWFREVPVYQAFSKSVPIAGTTMKNFKRLNEEGYVEDIVETSEVLEVHPFGFRVYEVYTENSTYIVSVFR